MKLFNYLLQGFGYLNFSDFQTTVFKIFYQRNLSFFIAGAFTFGTIREFFVEHTGLDVIFWIVFAFLIVAEWQTGINVAIQRGEKFKSRKFGRMLLKIAVYKAIILVLHALSQSTKQVAFEGFEVNPIGWLYYVVLVAIVFQLVISYLENLGNLGYREAKGIAGIILRRYNKWFEFDGTKDGDSFTNTKSE